MDSGRKGITRRGFLVSSGVAAALSRNPRKSMAADPITTFAGKAPGEMIEEIDGNRLLVTLAPGGRNWTLGVLRGVVSTDSGRTWGEPFTYQQGGKALEATLFPARPMIRLKDGTLGLIYSLEEKGGFGYLTRQWFFATSANGGQTWDAGHPIDAPAIFDPECGVYLQFLWGDVIQLASGRLVCPAYWYMGGRHPGIPPTVPYPTIGSVKGQKISADGHLFEGAMGGCYAYFSDDTGRTWRRSTGSMMVWPLPSETVGGFGTSWEPVAHELKDGRVLMLMRTNVGRIFQSVSRDGGDHWSSPEPTTLPSGDVPCALGRLRTTGDLVVVWNQASAEEIRRGYSRGRLSLALSNDEGKTWGRFRTLALSDGLAPADRIEPEPIRHIRAQPGDTQLPDGYARYHYPGLAFIQRNLVLVHRTGNHVAGGRPQWVDLKVIPEERLYS